MKAFTALLVLGSAALTSAQSQCLSVASNIPACGTSCLTSAGSAVGCAYTDFACQCSSSQSAAIASAALNCVLSACGAVTGLQVSTSALAVCACVSTAAPASSSAPASSAASPTSSASAGSSASSATSAPKSSAAPTTSAAVSKTGNSTVTTSSTAAVFTGGAAQIIGATGALAGGLLALIAAL